MKLSHFNLKHILARIQSLKNPDFRTITTKAHHDWKVILIGFFVLSITVMIYNTLLFFKINSGELSVAHSSIEQASDIVSKKNLKDVVNFFGAREQQLLKLRAEKPRVEDPSL